MRKVPEAVCTHLGQIHVPWSCTTYPKYPSFQVTAGRCSVSPAGLSISPDTLPPPEHIKSVPVFLGVFLQGAKHGDGAAFTELPAPCPAGVTTFPLGCLRASCQALFLPALFCVGKLIKSLGNLVLHCRELSPHTQRLGVTWLFELLHGTFTPRTRDVPQTRRAERAEWNLSVHTLCSHTCS